MLETMLLTSVLTKTAKLYISAKKTFCVHKMHANCVFWAAVELLPYSNERQCEIKDSKLKKEPSW